MNTTNGQAGEALLLIEPFLKLRTRVQRAIEEENHSFEAIFVLARAASNKDGRLLSGLIMEAELSKFKVSRLTKGLTRSGLACEEINPQDRRQHRLVATERGARVLKRIDRLVLAAVLPAHQKLLAARKPETVLDRLRLAHKALAGELRARPRRRKSESALSAGKPQSFFNDDGSIRE